MISNKSARNLRFVDIYTYRFSISLLEQLMRNVIIHFHFLTSLNSMNSKCYQRNRIKTNTDCFHTCSENLIILAVTVLAARQRRPSLSIKTTLVIMEASMVINNNLQKQEFIGIFLSI